MGNAGKLDLRAVLRLARRYGWIVLVCGVAAGALAFVFAHTTQKQYTASASVLFRSEQQDQEAAGLQVVTNTDPQSAIDTDLRLATLPSLADRAAAQVGRGVTAAQVGAATSVAQVGDTYVATVTATWDSPYTAAAVANAYSDALTAARRSADAAYYENALRAVALQLAGLTPAQRNSTTGLDLQDRAASLRILSSLQASEAQVVQRAFPPTHPSSPAVAKDTGVGILVGLLLGFGLVAILHRSDRTMREPSDLEAAYGLPLLGVVPESRAFNLSQSPSARTANDQREAQEVFRLIRAHLQYFSVDNARQVLLVVSAAPGDGKSTVCWNLAVAAASAATRVLIIEADLRSPTMGNRYGLRLSPGLSDVLIGSAGLEDAAQAYDLDRVHTPDSVSTSSHATVDVLVAGAVLPLNPVQMIESHSMESLLESARKVYDLILIDTPPLVAIPDAFPLLRQVDGVIVVARLGRNRTDVAQRLRATLESGDAPLIGLVANGGISGRDLGYGYGYGYGQGRDNARDEVAASPVDS